MRILRLLCRSDFHATHFSMTTLALVAIAASIVAAALVIAVRRGTVRSAAGDSSRITVSRQWLMQHQSNDWP